MEQKLFIGREGGSVIHKEMCYYLVSNLYFQNHYFGLTFIARIKVLYCIILCIFH